MVPPEAVGGIAEQYGCPGRDRVGPGLWPSSLGGPWLSQGSQALCAASLKRKGTGTSGQAPRHAAK